MPSRQHVSFESIAGVGWDDEDFFVDEDLMMHLAGMCGCFDQPPQSVLSELERSAFSAMELPQTPTGEAQPSPEMREVSSPKTTFSFMKLPVELRIMIYMLHFNRLDDRKGGLLTAGYCLAGDCCPSRRYNEDVPVRMLLMVSRAVYEEAMPLYFRTKTFRFLYSGLSSILSTIGPRHRQHISKIVFIYSALKTTKDFPLLKDCPGLTELTILVDYVPKKFKKMGGRVEMMDMPGLKVCCN